MAKSKNRKKKVNTREVGNKKMMQHRIKLFNEAYVKYMDKSYPVLYRFATMVNSGNIKISFLRKTALEVALSAKMEQAVINAKETLKDKIENGE